MELEQLVAALGLPAGSTFATALNHIAKMKSDQTIALNQAQNPPLDKFVPRADYQVALNRAESAENGLKEVKQAELDVAINSEIDGALKAGKITPATKDYYIAQCRQEGGLEKFKEFVKLAPAVAGDTGLDDKHPGTGDLALNSEQQKVADLFGNSAEDLKKYGTD